MIKEIKEAFEIIQEKGLIGCSLTVYRGDEVKITSDFFGEQKVHKGRILGLVEGKDIDEDDVIFIDCGDGLIEEVLVSYIEWIEDV